VEGGVSAFDRLRGGLVVSVQAPPDSPLGGPGTMAAIARAAEAGGAVGIRAEGPDDVAAIGETVSVPVIGLRKRDHPRSPVRITPSVEDAREIVAAGADILAVDATMRARPDGSSTPEFIAALAELGVPVLADVDSFCAGVAAREAGAHAVATTLSGYTGDGPVPAEPDVELVGRLAGALDCPVIAEGRYGSCDTVRAALSRGAFAVVVGTAITDPFTLTRRFVAALDGAAG
jgi:N-acylglucosamine-6-phosphate 2-epimerase